MSREEMVGTNDLRVSTLGPGLQSSIRLNSNVTFTVGSIVSLMMKVSEI